MSQNSKISRKHLTIKWDADDSQWVIINHSKNGIFVDKILIEKDEEVILSQSRAVPIVIGYEKIYFCPVVKNPKRIELESNHQKLKSTEAINEQEQEGTQEEEEVIQQEEEVAQEEEKDEKVTEEEEEEEVAQEEDEEVTEEEVIVLDDDKSIEEQQKEEEVIDIDDKVNDNELKSNDINKRKLTEANDKIETEEIIVQDPKRSKLNE